MFKPILRVLAFSPFLVFKFAGFNIITLFLCYCFYISLVPRVFHVLVGLWGMLSCHMDRTQQRTRYTWPESYGTLVSVYLRVFVQTWIDESSEAYTLTHSHSCAPSLLVAQLVFALWRTKQDVDVLQWSTRLSGNTCTTMGHVTLHWNVCKISPNILGK